MCSLNVMRYFRPYRYRKFLSIPWSEDPNSFRNPDLILSGRNSSCNARHFSWNPLLRCFQRKDGKFAYRICFRYQKIKRDFLTPIFRHACLMCAYVRASWDLPFQLNHIYGVIFIILNTFEGFVEDNGLKTGTQFIISSSECSVRGFALYSVATCFTLYLFTSLKPVVPQITRKKAFSRVVSYYD